ncbi:hypothetical protein ACQZV8_20720, partial [Magnetococcales bacterium HHB-1]
CREIYEELDVSLTTWKLIQAYPQLKAKSPNVGFLFMVDQWRGEPSCMSQELLDIAWFDETGMRNLIKQDALAYSVMQEQMRFLGWNVNK